MGIKFGWENDKAIATSVNVFWNYFEKVLAVAQFSIFL